LRRAADEDEDDPKLMEVKDGKTKKRSC